MIKNSLQFKSFWKLPTNIGLALYRAHSTVHRGTLLAEGSLRYCGNKLINRGIAYSINTHTDRKADQYDFVAQHLKVNSSSSKTHIFERSIHIIIETDGNADQSCQMP